MNLSYTSAVFLVVLVSFLWGFWHQFVKKLGSWPLAAFMIWMYGIGTLIVWALIGLFREVWVPEGILRVLRQAPDKALIAALCGAGFSVGMMINLYVVSKMGLIFSTSVTSTAAIVLGTLLSSVLGGLPEDASMGQIYFGALILLCASYLCQAASRAKDKHKGSSAEEAAKTSTKFLTILIVYLLLFSQSYTVGMSLSVRTELRPNGLPGPVAVGMLALGATVAIVLICLVMLIKSGQISMLLHPQDKRCILYAAIGGFCCLGGDLIHNIASPILSVAIAFPLAQLSGVWQYFWGIVGGEFRGCGNRAKGLLTGGILCYILGVIWISLSRSGII